MNARALGRLLWSAVSFSFLLTLLLLALFLLVAPKLSSALPLPILTESMQPSMEPGTLAVVQPTHPSKLAVGDVVTYLGESDDPTFVTHRITDISRSSNGETTLLLQGDNNDAVDPPVKVEQVRGKVIYTVPHIGWITHTINSAERRKYIQWAAYGSVAYAALSLLGTSITGVRSPAKRTRRTAKGQHRALA